ncbi:UNVERIFIED_CONTAM: hypothetical protein H355_012283, partial [Colinus virginianus]
NMLDLSFLTEEEYEKLMKVLQRDAELKKKDGDRIRRIQGSIKDEKKKKFVTGEWFSDVKAKRFQEDLEGSDLLRASIRRKKGKLESNGLSPPPAKLSEDAVLQPSCAIKEAADGATDTTAGPKRPPEQAYAPSRIPVKRKPSRTLSRSEQFVNHLGPAENNLEKREVLASPRLLTMEGESSQAVKPGVNYTISSMSNKEEDIGLDREHFKNLKNFWEKGADSVMMGSVPESPGSLEEDGRQFKLCRSLSVQSGHGQNSEEKPGAFPKTRTPYKRTITLSSSEEEPSYVAPVRKGSVSIAPRSTYAKSKGGLVTRNNSLGESNGKPSVPEEEKAAQRSSKKSRLPVRVPSIKIESPTKEVSGSTFEPETPPEKFIVAEERKRAVSSLASRVQILIEPAVASGDKEEEKAQRSDVGTQDNMEINGELPEEKACQSSEQPRASVPAGGREAVQKMDLSVHSEEDGDHSPAAQALAHANSVNLAKSMVNIYTTTESCWPDLLSYQLDTLHAGSSFWRKQDELRRRQPRKQQQKLKKPIAKKPVSAKGEGEGLKEGSLSGQENQYMSPKDERCFAALASGLYPGEGSFSEASDRDGASASHRLSLLPCTLKKNTNKKVTFLYFPVSGSVLSVYSGDFGSVDAQGTVEFALDYDEKNREFQVHVSQCKDLAVVDEKKDRTDPYVKTYLLPDKARMGKRKTSVKKRTVNPIYNEVLRYKIEKMVLLIQKLNLSVWHNDPLGRNSFLGEIELDLASWDWSNRKLNWYPLKPRSLSAVNGVDHRGVMNLSIKYVPPGSLGPKNPPSGEVHIWVKDVKDLLQLRPSGVDSFVKCYVLPDTSKKSYQKTRVVKRDTNPVFNHTIVYDGFHTEDLKDACVELTMWDHEKLTNHFLGGIRLGLGTGLSYGIPVDWMDSTQEEVAFWQEMMSATNEWIEGLLPLRSLAGRKKLK